VTRLSPGDKAPAFSLPDDTGTTVKLSDFKGSKVVLYVYPAAMTPGCTKQACDFRDNLSVFTDAGYAVLGLSPDKPEKLARFREAEGLTFPLLSDVSKETLTAYGAYGEKQLYGKTVVGAYLVGSRATARHAAFLGLTVTITHTLGVFALGFATLFASAYVVPERIFPVLGFVSGLVVLGMGVVLAIQRWPAAREAMGRSAHSFRRAAHAGYVMGRLQHAHSTAGWHSHGGTWHTHAPPADRVTWGGLLALGVSGGLVPCPSAMVLLLAAVALNKTAFGLALVVAFSTGLAMTLTAIGLLFLYARNRLPTGARAPRWTRIVPLASAAAIVLIGALLCHAALTGGPI